MSYCAKCGAFVGENRFCANCGAEVQSDATVVPENNQPQVNAYTNQQQANVYNNQPPMYTYNTQPPMNAYNYSPVYVTQTIEARSPYYDQIISYHRAAKSYYTCGLLSLILCMGIGSIFQFICFIKTFVMIKYGRLFDHSDIIRNYPREWEILTTARRRHNKGRTMFIIGTVLTSILYIILFAVMASGF